MNRYEVMNQQRRQTEETPKRVVAYCRVSTDKSDQANSYENQQKYFKEYIDRMPEWELYEIFADRGITGTNTKKRKEFNRMITCAKQGDFDLIITKEISRFARNTLDSIRYTRELRKQGVYVIFLNDGIDTRESDSELRLTIMASIGQEESRKTSERVKWGQKRQMEQGVVFGRSMLGYDIRGGKMFINEEGAKIVRLIFNKCVYEGKGSHTIARELREAGYKTITGSAKWSNTTIFKILRNEKYCGDLVQKKTFTPDYLSHDKKYNKGEEEFIIIKEHHPYIISRDMFEEANRILDERSPSKKGKSTHSNRYCFSGKIVCGVCGSKYGARYKTRKSGSIYKAWRCLEATRHGQNHIDKAGNEIGCSSKGIRNDDAMHIMSLVVDSLKPDKQTIIKNTIDVIQSVISRETLGPDIERVQRKIKTIEDERTRLLELYMSKDISRDEFAFQRAKCNSKLDELNQLLDGIDKRNEIIHQQSQLINDINSAVNEITDSASMEEAFYRNLLDRMVIYSRDNIEVYLKLLPHKWRFALSKPMKVLKLCKDKNGSAADEFPEI